MTPPLLSPGLGDAPEPDLGALLEPRSVAVIGASDDPARIGGRPLRYMREAGFAHPLYPVNPKRATVQGLAAYASVAELPEAADCALIAVPAGLVESALGDCARRGVRSAVIFSSGFAEVDDEGAVRQARLRAIARDTGIRVVGPNCLGVFNSALGFYGTFTSSMDAGLPEPGGVAIVSQSGAYGSHVFAVARTRGLGVRYWMTTGNECDVDLAEGIAWVARRPEIRVIIAYAEGVRDGPGLRRALELARSLRKPVIFMKVGRTALGAAAAASHTAALAGSDAVYDAVFRAHGVLRAETTEELLDAAYACAAGGLPAGRRIGLVTISGGVGVQMADAAIAEGLEVAPMPELAQARLKEILPYAAPRNPVDITAQAFNDLELVRQNFQLMLAEGGYDVIVAFFTMVAASPYIVEQLLEILAELRGAFPERVIVLSLVGGADIVRRYEDAGYLVFEDPSRAIRAVAGLARIREGFDRPATGITEYPAPVAVPRRALGERESALILAAAGLPLVEARLATSAEEAAAHAAAFAWPVALKASAPGLAHKSEVGGVLLGIDGPAAAAEGYETLIARLAAAAPEIPLEGVLVAPMVAGGIETLLGVVVDPVFGPAVLFGLGGIFAEVLQDTALRLAPFDEQEAAAMIREIRGFALLDGARGRPKADLAALARALAALSRFAAAGAADLASVDINPFLVLPEGQGTLGLDALVVAKPAEESA